METALKGIPATHSFPCHPNFILHDRLTNGAAVQLTGKLLPSPGAGQERELLVELGKGETDTGSAHALGKNTEKGNVELIGKCNPEVGSLPYSRIFSPYESVFLGLVRQCVDVQSFLVNPGLHVYP
jgi:hypothetical protein